MRPSCHGYSCGDQFTGTRAVISENQFSRKTSSVDALSVDSDSVI